MPTITAGPFGAVVDSADPNQRKLTRLVDALNVYNPDPKDGAAVLARHGFMGLATALGTAAVRTGQGTHLHRSLAGLLYRYTFGGGKMYLWDGGTGFTDITPAGITIDASNPIFCATYNDEVVITDEQNKPWIYTPTTGAAAVIEYNAALDPWATKGGPVVYGGFIFFLVKGSGEALLELQTTTDVLVTEDGLPLTTELTSGHQNQIAWGNALDARTGYNQGAYDHVWQLTQTSSDTLGALYADESALVYLRNVGIGYITGDVDDDFRTSSTRDAIDEVVGTDAPAAVVGVHKKIWFADLDGRVHRCSAGGGEAEPLWFPVRREVTERMGTAASRANVAAYARAAYHSGYDLVLFTLWDRQTIYAFHASTGKYMGQWEVGGGIHVTAMGALVDNSNRSTFLLLGTRSTSYTAADLGVVWRQKFPDDASQWLDQADASIAVHTAFSRAAETQWLDHRGAKAFRAHDVTASLVGDSVRHAVRLQYVVPSSGLSAALVAQSSAVVGEMSASDSISTAKWTLGRNAQGSAMRLRLSATHADNVQWGVHEIAVEMTITKARPRAA